MPDCSIDGVLKGGERLRDPRTADDHFECQRLCQADDQCTHFAFAPSVRECSLYKDSIIKPVDAGVGLVGPKYCEEIGGSSTQSAGNCIFECFGLYQDGAKTGTNKKRCGRVLIS